MVFPLDLSKKGLSELSRDAPLSLFKDRRVLIQTQSSVTANSPILQIDVWSQAIVDPKDRNKKT
ncbi:MAG: hypothetical protein D3922_01980 [Candidatus Electrothrix sp. AR1]|nr:hypothetical protein [Candidatus Electrothrix sp. AR1]